MSAAIEPRPLTTRDLLELEDEGQGFELVNGRLVEVNRNVLSCLVAGQLFSLLAVHCREARLGCVFVQRLGFEWGAAAPNTVRRPDVAFIRRGRLPESEWAEDFCHVVPDLAVEVVSPNDTFDEVDTKVEEYLRLGVQFVWVVSLETRQVYVHRRDGTVVKVREEGELSGESVVPGFRCPVKDLFPTAEEQAALANGIQP
jgi:Uma2 family endonuclease